MKQHHKIISVIMGLVVLGVALPVTADTIQDGITDEGAQPLIAAVHTSVPVIITELQTGASTAGDEFVELYNTGDTPVDISGWQVRFLNASSASGTSTVVATVSPDVTLPGRTHYVLHTPSIVLPANTLGQQYNAALSGKDKAIGLFAPDVTTCQLQVQDAIAWGAGTKGEGTSLLSPDADANKHVYRYVTSTGHYVDTDNNTHDAALAAVGVNAVAPQLAPGATLGALNAEALANDTNEALPGSSSALAPVHMNGCAVPPAPEAPSPASEVPPQDVSPPAVVEPVDDDDDPSQPVLPVGNIGLTAPQISELLPNPAKPQTDANDEFIELYNSNNAPFDLSGFILEAGATSKKRYTFPAGTMLAPKSFKAFYSRDTNLALSNTQGQVWLLDPFGRVIGQTDAYESAKDGQAWLTAEGKWQWTTMPTPDAINIVKAPTAKKKASTTAAKTQVSSTTGSVKSAKTSGTDSAVAPSNDKQQAGASSRSFNPLHPGILALTGVIAVLYALYEYRRDLANKLHQFRANRAARRSLGQSPEGR